MKTEIKYHWVTALKSSVYVQASGYLLTTTGYCCLGVLCDLYSHATGNNWEPGQWNGRETVFSFCAFTRLLPPAVVQWAGLNTYDPVVFRHGEYDMTLASLNDQGMPFEEIADIINEKL